MARRRSGKKIDSTRWTRTNATFLAQSAGAAAIELLASGTDTETILRTRGHLLAFLDGTQAPGVLVLMSVGFILVPEGTGTTVLWSPNADPNAPWLYIARFVLGYEEYVTDVVSAQGAAVFREVIDSKAMRVIRPDTEVQCVTENNTLASAGTVNLTITSHMLLGH